MIVHKIKWWVSVSDGQHYFHTTSRNGKTVQPSEGYPKKAVMMKTIKRIVEQYSLPVPVIQVEDPAPAPRVARKKKGA